MRLAITVKVFYHPDQLLYDPKNEMTSRGARHYPERPERVTRILESLKSGGLEIEKVQETLDSSLLLEVHSNEYIEFLTSLPPVVDEQVPSIFNLRGKSLDKPKLEKLSLMAKLGIYFFDIGTPISPHLYKSAVAAASTSHRLAVHLLENDQGVALCRPPGHHAMRDMGGGYCFLNNVAVCAVSLLKSVSKVAILDLDYHHGNGTQELFYQRSDVYYVSIHGDPTHNFPYYWGYEDEQGQGNGLGYTKNFPLAKSSGEQEYLKKLNEALLALDSYSPDVLLISLGLDTLGSDGLFGLNLTEESFNKMGVMIKQFGFKKLGVILEGGYNLDAIGSAFLKFIQAFTE